jgi:penicillin-binding protein 1C
VGKAQEALWALRLTAHLPRERILREYLDRVPLGNSTFGVESAAQLYFGRPAAALSAAQAALLAGMARSPARYDPYRHPEASRARMLRVLRAMRAARALTAEQVAPRPRPR